MNPFAAASTAASSRGYDETLWLIVARLSSTDSFYGSQTTEPMGKTFPPRAQAAHVRGHTIPQPAFKKGRQGLYRLIHASFQVVRRWHWIWVNRAHSTEESQ
jgi:hypothetical protein